MVKGAVERPRLKRLHVLKMSSRLGQAGASRLSTLIAGSGLIALALVGWLAWWAQAPLVLRLQPGATVLDVQVAAGSTAQRVVHDMVAAGVSEPVWLLQGALRLSGQDARLKAGSYELPTGITPLQLLDKLVRGDSAVRSVTLVEGWTFAQMRLALQNAEHLKQETQAQTANLLMKTIGRPGQHPEGRFFPDTYVYPKGSSDIGVWRQAAAAMERKLADAWEQRDANLPLKTPDEALILASIIEKETGRETDRKLVSGVFINRLRIGMRLQTDPTVAYAAGPDFDGRLRRKHLDTDTPYNTYTRIGLPPTPIAAPGWASLQAAVRPANTRAFYFVARGDGSSQFSETLAEHNQAVRRHILNQP